MCENLIIILYMYIQIFIFNYMNWCDVMALPCYLVSYLNQWMGFLKASSILIWQFESQYMFFFSFFFMKSSFYHINSLSYVYFSLIYTNVAGLSMFWDVLHHLFLAIILLHLQASNFTFHSLSLFYFLDRKWGLFCHCR